MTPEAKVKKQVVAVLKQHGVYYFYPVTGGFGASGVPDFVCCAYGFFFAIECKAGKNKPTALQQANIERILAAKGVAVVVNESNIDDVDTILQMLKAKFVYASSKMQQVQRDEAAS